jgi:hypothetical protein
VSDSYKKAVKRLDLDGSSICLLLPYTYIMQHIYFNYDLKASTILRLKIQGTSDVLKFTVYINSLQINCSVALIKDPQLYYVLARYLQPTSYLVPPNNSTLSVYTTLNTMLCFAQHNALSQLKRNANANALFRY